MEPTPFNPFLIPFNPLLIPGYCFRPTDEQMVELFLVDKLLGRRRFPYSQIKEGVDVYLHDPDDLPIDINGSSQIWAYFLVKGAGCNRKTPGGYWELADSEVEEEEIVGDGERIMGYLKEFVFRRGIAPDGVETDWMMKEYRLNLDEVKDPIDPKMENYVVCMIYKEIPDPLPFKVYEDNSDEELEEMVDDGQEEEREASTTTKEDQ